MPRNASGTYTLPTGNPVVSGDIISSTWANDTMGDIASALTASLARDGSGGMTAALRVVDGSVSVPGLAFGNETGSGLYRSAAGDVGLAILGNQILRMRSTGLDVTGALSYTGTLTGGTGVINIGSGQIYKDASGNVGIGTSSPAYKLDVTDSFRINASANANDAAFYLRSGSTSGTLQQILFQMAGSSGDVRIVGSNQNNALWFTTNGSERIRIDSSGRVGIGTGSPAAPLHVQSTTVAIGRFQGGSGAGNGAYAGFHGQGAFAGYIGTESGITGTGTNNSLAMYAASTNPITLWTNGSERMRIDSSGNVGIGLTNPTVPLEIQSNTSALGLVFRGRASDNISLIRFINNAASAAYSDIEARSDLFLLNAIANIPMLFATNNVERMRIDSSGRMLVGLTGTRANGGQVQAYASGQAGFVTYTITTNSSTALYFENPNGIVGTIVTNGSATAYNTSSDYRLKEQVTPMTGALAKNELLNPVTYKWKSDGSDGQGFIAHELQAVFPDAVTGEKDAVDDEGKPVYQGVDTSFLVGHLVACVKELNAKVAALEAAV